MGVSLYIKKKIKININNHIPYIVSYIQDGASRLNSRGVVGHGWGWMEARGIIGRYLGFDLFISLER